MNFDLKVVFTQKVTLKAVVKFNINGKLTPLAPYSSRLGQSSQNFWGIRTDINTNDELYLYYEYELLPHSSLPTTLPLTIHISGNADLGKALTVRHDIRPPEKAFTIHVSGFGSGPSKPLFSAEILKRNAKLPHRVAMFFQAPYTTERGSDRYEIKQGASPIIKNNQSNDSDNSRFRSKQVDPSRDFKLNQVLTRLEERSHGKTEIFSSSPPPPFKTESHFPVWYATNRQPLFTNAGILSGFSTIEVESISYGECHVHIPKSHDMGKIESGFWRRLMLLVTGKKDDQKLRLELIKPLQTAEYWAAIQQEAAKWSPEDRCALVFLHGYNVSFEEAAIRTAQIGCDLKVQGPISFFSWPSLGTLDGYGADEAAVQSSEEHMTQYLLDFARNCGADRIHVIAHSMGNLGLLRSIQRIVAGAAANTPKLFDHFVLAAPDVDQKVFLKLANNYNRVAKHTTLYVSNKDKALASAKMLRINRARAGLTPPVTIVPNIDTVHVANVDMSLLGHGYVAEAREVLTDISELLTFDAPPRKRTGLRPAEEEGNRYWVIGA